MLKNRLKMMIFSLNNCYESKTLSLRVLLSQSVYRAAAG